MFGRSKPVIFVTTLSLQEAGGRSQDAAHLIYKSQLLSPLASTSVVLLCFVCLYPNFLFVMEKKIFIVTALLYSPQPLWWPCKCFLWGFTSLTHTGTLLWTCFGCSGRPESLEQTVWWTAWHHVNKSRDRRTKKYFYNTTNVDDPEPLIAIIIFPGEARHCSLYNVSSTQANSA